MYGSEGALLPIGNSDSPQTRTETAVQSERSLAFDNVLDGLIRGLFPVVVSTLRKADNNTHLVLVLGLDSSSSRQKDQRAVTPTQASTTQCTGTNDAKAEMTDYVAVIATIPPAAPAKEWIVESLGIVKSYNGGGGDGECGLS